MGTDDALVAVLAAKFAEYRPDTDGRGWGLYPGAGGAGGCSAAGLRAGRGGGRDCEDGRVSRATVMAGAGELAGGAEPRARVPQ